MPQSSLSSLLCKQNSAPADTLHFQEIKDTILVFLSFFAFTFRLWQTLESSVLPLVIRS